MNNHRAADGFSTPMKLQLQRDKGGTLIARRAGGNLLRLGIGLPLLAFGGLQLFGAFSSLALAMGANGFPGAVEALPAFVGLVIMGGVTAPIAWWLAFSRHWIALDRDGGAVVIVSDWRFGRREKRHSLDCFAAVRVALEPLAVSSKPMRTRTTHVQMIRLLPRDRAKASSLEIGWFAEKEHELAVQSARQIAEELGLPLKGAD